MRKEAEAQEHSLTSTTFLIFHYCSLKMQLLKKKRRNELQSLYPPTSDIALLSELWCFTTSFGNENSDIVLLSELEALSTSILDPNAWDIVNTNFSNCRKSNNWKEIWFANNNLYWCIMSTNSVFFYKRISSNSIFIEFDSNKNLLDFNWKMDWSVFTINL